MIEILHFSLISAIITLAAAAVMWYFLRYDFDYNDIYNDALELYKRRQYKAAASKLKLALSRFPDKPNAQYNLGLCALKLKQYAQAREAFQNAYNLNKRDLDTTYNLGYAEMCLKNYEKAKEYFNLILKDYPDEADTLFNMGYICGEGKNFQEAKDYIQKALGLAPERTGFKKYYVEVLDSLFEETVNPKLLEEMLNLCLELTNILPSDENLQFKIAVAYAKMGDWENSVIYCEKMIDLNPSSYQACSQYGLTLFCKGETKRAVEMYERAIKLEPNIPDSYLNLVFAYDKLGDFDKAIKLVDTFIKRFPDEPAVEIAKDYLDRQSEKDPDDLPDLVGLPTPISRRKVDLTQEEPQIDENLAEETQDSGEAVAQEDEIAEETIRENE